MAYFWRRNRALSSTQIWFYRMFRRAAKQWKRVNTSTKLLATFKQASAIALIVLCVWIHFQPAALATNRITDDVFFKQLTDASYAAWNTQNPEAVAEFYLKDPSIVIYDATPLKYQGWQDFRFGIQTHLFDKLNRFQLSANNDLHAIHYGDSVLTTFTYHLSAESKDGQAIEAEGRQTDLWQQHDGRWLIVHEHTSAPVSL
ncbi:MAG: YybH family protein [Leptolyngbyaceae cyanobacterium]